MRLIEILLSLSFIFVFSIAIGRFSFAFNDVNTRICEVKEKSDSLFFISESFRKTCEGKGFSSLEEWQKVCGAMWKLDYIAWSDACEFMPVEKGEIFYGTWRNSSLSGEVYYR